MGTPETPKSMKILVLKNFRLYSMYTFTVDKYYLNLLLVYVRRCLLHLLQTWYGIINSILMQMTKNYSKELVLLSLHLLFSLDCFWILHRYVLLCISVLLVYSTITSLHNSTDSTSNDIVFTSHPSHAGSYSSLHYFNVSCFCVSVVHMYVCTFRE